MYRKKNEAKIGKEKAEYKDRWLDIVIGVILATLTIISIPTAILGIINEEKNVSFWVVIGGAIAAGVGIGKLYYDKAKHMNDLMTKGNEHKREQKKNQINQAVFDALYDSNHSKIKEIFRYTYGTVPKWNPINYRENVLVYDVHEQIRSILISLKKCIIDIDPERFNDRNVVVDLIYCYKNEQDEKSNEILDWRLISSGNTSGNKNKTSDYVNRNDSFYALLQNCGTVFKNDKMAVTDTYISYIKDIKDIEYSQNGKCIGSAIGKVINIRNDNPEEIFVQAMLTITTYGEEIFAGKYINKENVKVDKDGMSEKDYENIFKDTIISTFSKLLETELAQMYIRHSIKEGNMCPITGMTVDRNKSIFHCQSCERCTCETKRKVKKNKNNPKNHRLARVNK